MDALSCDLSPIQVAETLKSVENSCDIETHILGKGKLPYECLLSKWENKGVVEMGKCIRKYPGSDAGDRNGPFTRVTTYTEYV